MTDQLIKDRKQKHMRLEFEFFMKREHPRVPLSKKSGRYLCPAAQSAFEGFKGAWEIYPVAFENA